MINKQQVKEAVDDLTIYRESGLAKDDSIEHSVDVIIDLAQAYLNGEIGDYVGEAHYEMECFTLRKKVERYKGALEKIRDGWKGLLPCDIATKALSEDR